ncbi:hypothetical protein AVEN_31895-1 [Araneus ventricosus]|uniref:Uncharacterized protein n=1 Tax=Araneus ventricosus TaxID=182803 RepID=A0A4Y2WTX0_ARAVE|nr:hypothetical protein AVEN_31895-1 [Araneus ventricosus]
MTEIFLSISLLLCNAILLAYLNMKHTSIVFNVPFQASGEIVWDWSLNFMLWLNKDYSISPGSRSPSFTTTQVTRPFDGMRFRTSTRRMRGPDPNINPLRHT